MTARERTKIMKRFLKTFASIILSDIILTCLIIIGSLIFDALIARPVPRPETDDEDLDDFFDEDLD